MDKIIVVQDDITKLKVDAIVNAANTSLSDGAGVNGAIHRAAGPQLLEACRQLGGCEVGEAKITLGYNLPARYIIHTVGPIWQGGQFNEPKLLANCYINSLLLAKDYDIKTIAFSAISCGIFGYPIPQAVKIAVSTVQSILEQGSLFEQVIFVCFDNDIFKLYNELI